MKQYLRLLPLPILVFSVLTVLDLSVQPIQIHWLSNLGHALLLTVIGCAGQYLIHKNVLKEDSEDDDDSGCIGCGKPE